MSMSSWTQVEVLKLIELYKNAPELWDKRHKLFRDSNAKSRALRNIRKQLYKTQWDIDSKLKSLRTFYNKTHKRIMAKHRAGGGKYRGPVWFGYKPMSYLLIVYDNEVNNEKEALDKYYSLVYDREHEQGTHEPEPGMPETEFNQSSWKPKETFKLIDMFRDNPELWNTEHEQYTNKRKRLKILRSIAATLNRTPLEVRLKLKRLRGLFNKAHKRIQTGLDADGKYHGTVWYAYKSLSFLNKDAFCVDNNDTTAEVDVSQTDTGVSSDTTISKKESYSTDSSDEDSTFWTQDEILRLIELYKSEPIMWDPNHEEHANREKKMECLKSFSKILNKTRFDIENKFKNLKTTYQRACRIITTAIEIKGEHTGKVWFAFKPMSFLGNLYERHLERQRNKLLKCERETTSNTDIPTEYSDADDDCKINEMKSSETCLQISEDENMYEEYLEVSDDDPLQVLMPNRETNFVDTNRTTKLQLNKQTDNNYHEFQVFGQFVAQELQKIKNEYSLAFAKKQITDVIFNAQMNDLKN